VASLPLAGALAARYGSRRTSRAAALLFCAVLPLPLLAPDSCSGSASARSMCP
jgi:hypothetical protein